MCMERGGVHSVHTYPSLPWPLEAHNAQWILALLLYSLPLLALHHRVMISVHAGVILSEMELKEYGHDRHHHSHHYHPQQGQLRQIHIPGWDNGDWTMFHGDIDHPWLTNDCWACSSQSTHSPHSKFSCSTIRKRMRNKNIDYSSIH